MAYGDSVVWTGQNSSEDQSIKWEITEAAKRRDDVIVGPVAVSIAQGSTPVQAATALQSAWNNAANGITACRDGAKVTFDTAIDDMLFSTDGGTNYTDIPDNGNNVNVGATGLQVHNAS